MALPLTPQAVQRALEEAKAREQQQQMLAQTLRATLQAPHTIERFELTMVELVEEEPNYFLRVATPTGKRYDVNLGTDLSQFVMAAVKARKAAGKVVEGESDPEPPAT